MGGNGSTGGIGSDFYSSIGGTGGIGSDYTSLTGGKGWSLRWKAGTPGLKAILAISLRSILIPLCHH